MSRFRSWSPRPAGRRTLGIALVCALLPMASVAEDAPGVDVEAFEERLSRLEDELQATRDELQASRGRVDAQQEVLERAGLTEDDSFASSLSRFLEQTEFAGWVSGSYFWNFNRPTNDSGRGENTGNPVMGLQGRGLTHRLHPDHNSFQFDEAWFAMSRQATEESRGGFALDVVFGQTADAMRGEDVAVYQAYGEYLVPMGPGFLIRAGRFASPLRSEPLAAMRRFNVTEGLVAGQLHPDSHTGVTVHTQLGPIRVMAGGANDTLLDPESDFGDGKTVLFGMGFDLSETITLDAHGAWGESGILPGNTQPGLVGIPSHITGRDLGIASGMVRWFPSDLLTTYVNVTYVWTDGLKSVQGGPPGAIARVPGNPEAYALVVGSHYSASDQTSFGFRGEAIWSMDNLLDPTLSRTTAGCGPCTRSDQRIWALTGTLDHAFTESAGFRIEARFDEASVSQQGFENFYRDRNGLKRRQWTTGVEAYYRF